MSLHASLLPLRMMNSEQDLGMMLGAWMDSFPSSLGLRSDQCQEDLFRISSLRQFLAKSIPDRDSYEEALQLIDVFHTYYHYLVECEDRGLKPSTSLQQQHRKQQQQQPQYLILEWESAMIKQRQAVANNLEWDRAGIIWNLAALEAYQATQQQPLTTKAGWTKAAQHLQTAASWLKHLPGRDQQLITAPSILQQTNYPDFGQTFVQLWQSLLVAQAQRCVYESLACAPRPRHLLLAKLAAAAVPLFSTVESIVLKDDDSAAPSLCPFSSLVTGWADFARAWGMYMSCKAQYHQSQISRDRKQWGQELARLNLSYQHATMCKEMMDEAPSDGLHELYTVVEQTLTDLKERVDELEQLDHGQPVPSRHELTEIRGEMLVNVDQPLSQLLKAKTTDPLFQIVPQGLDIRPYIELFDSEMAKRLIQITDLCELRTNEGRTELAKVDLPHALTAYHHHHHQQQLQTSDGLPEDLWRQIETIQREQRIALMKQAIWELRDLSDIAKTTFQKIEAQLDFDLESDRMFRTEHPGFEGHDAEEVQRAFRKSLANYNQLLQVAQGGDETLLKRLDQLDTNPKFKLLQFQRSQLDMLLPGATEGNRPTTNTFDTSTLSRLLVELSSLFTRRETLLNSLHDSVKTFDIYAALESQVDPTNKTDQAYQQAVLNSIKSFDGIFQGLQDNIDQQIGLLRTILSENERFQTAQERSNGSNQSGESCIPMIEDAIEDVVNLTSHLDEGKRFYNIIIPKLEKLKHQVGDVSARLTVERLEYNDLAHQVRQEEKDAMMAQKLSSDNAAASVARSGEETTEFDEKVATLVAMEFDPAKVVEALQKHDNNVDQALNDLLSS
ncbi:BRO1-like domain containing protein [Nitzschia inconspicua]|uniref:BRO1-like domain containing protein n=1 Tax=Nitzschia inconspicua TaxID=303405 RepID=A0A9K3PJ35_9STRA|nr:BRO1-like domain containing protein [Nitzschia inconspicua]